MAPARHLAAAVESRQVAPDAVKSSTVADDLSPMGYASDGMASLSHSSQVLMGSAVGIHLCSHHVRYEAIIMSDLRSSTSPWLRLVSRKSMRAEAALEVAVPAMRV